MANLHTSVLCTPNLPRVNMQKNSKTKKNQNKKTPHQTTTQQQQKKGQTTAKIYFIQYKRKLNLFLLVHKLCCSPRTRQKGKQRERETIEWRSQVGGWQPAKLYLSCHLLTQRQFKRHCIVISVVRQKTRLSDMEQVVNRPTDLQEDFNWVRTRVRRGGGWVLFISKRCY